MIWGEKKGCCCLAFVIVADFCVSCDIFSQQGKHTNAAFVAFYPF